MDKNTVCALIRTYNNNTATRGAVERAFAAGFGHVVVVVNDEKLECRGTIREALTEIRRAMPDRLHVFEMAQGYTWANALNLGFAHALHLDEEARLLRATQAKYGIPSSSLGTIVVPVSVEARYTKQHLSDLLAPFTNAAVGLVGTTFAGEREDGTPVPLGSSYCHPRNTFMAVHLDAFRLVGPFSPVCDQLGGMEDLHYLVRLEATQFLAEGAKGHGVRFEWRQLDLKVPLLIGKNYDQGQKEERELAAIRKIAAYERRILEGLGTILTRLGVS